MADKKTDWKSKYYELRSKHINAIDVSFRLGYQEGLKAAELQNMQMQLQQAQQQAAAAAQMGAMPPEAGGMPPEAGAMPPEEAAAMEQGGEMPPEEAAAMEQGGEMPPEEGDELDSSIQELESYVSKNERVDFNKLMKSLHKSNVKSKQSSDISERHKKIDEILKKW
jgi:hypothetical protein